LLKLTSFIIDGRKYNVYPFSPEMPEKLPCPHLLGTDMGVFLSSANADAQIFHSFAAFTD